MNCNCGNCQWSRIRDMRRPLYCDRCGTEAAPYYLETYNPTTEEHHTYHLCADCQTKADTLLLIFLEGAERLMHCDAYPVTASIMIWKFVEWSGRRTA